MAVRSKSWLPGAAFVLRPGPTGATRLGCVYFLLDLQRLECV